MVVTVVVAVVVAVVIVVVVVVAVKTVACKTRQERTETKKLHLILFRDVPFRLRWVHLANRRGAGQFGSVLIFGLKLFWFMQAGVLFGIRSRGRYLRILASKRLGGGVGYAVVRSVG